MTTRRAAPFDWRRFEAELFRELRRTLAAFGRAHRTRRFYAVALHAIDAELDGLLPLPMLAAASEPGAAPDENGWWGPRWQPADMSFPEVPPPAPRDETALRLERALTAEAKRSTQAHWRRTEARHMRLVVRVARRLRDVAPRLIRVTDDFVLYVADEEGGPELASRTIPRALFARLFTPQVEEKTEEARVAAMPPKKRAAFLVTRFGTFGAMGTETAQRELLRMGGVALDALLGALDDPKNGWTAAMLVGKIGVSRPDVVEALRRRAAESHWHATALGMLGDHGWLAEQPVTVAAHGFAAPYKAISAGRSRPLDYRPLERFLGAAGEPARAAIAEELAPGSSYVSAQRGDVPVALRGLGSAHAPVRWHAASLLGERGLGAAAGKTILPALAGRLGDPDPIVRRLAVLAISYWKAAGRAHRDAIATLSGDPDPLVRRTVEHVLRHGFD